MCAVSMVGDFYSDKWKQGPFIQPTYPINPGIVNPPPNLLPSVPLMVVNPNISREEFDQLKKEVADMKELLIRAKKYDEANGEPNCEMDEKVALLKQIAKLVGVDLSEVFGK